MRSTIEAGTLLVESALGNLRLVKKVIEEHNRARPETYYGYPAADNLRVAVGHVEYAVEHLRDLLREFEEEK